MSEIANLQPQAIWRNFDLLTQVPRPSGHLARVQQFLLEWAASKNVEAFQDPAGNIIMRKPATPGYEDRLIVTLQGHMDMVPQAEAGSTHCFETDPISTYIDGEWVRAKGTTLGADDGMAVATIMAIMEDDTLPHGPIEGFITADEETTMYGVEHMAADVIKGDILLNLDNETEGEMIIGSAGGVNMTATLQYQPTSTPATTTAAVRVSLSQLLGGHSGLEINEGRLNANKAMARIVRSAITHHHACLSEWVGGNMRNAIPRQATVLLTLPIAEVEAFEQRVATWQTTLQAEFGHVEHALQLKVERLAECPKQVVPAPIQDNLVDALCGVHNGVFRFIPDVPGIVETSSNLAIVNIGSGNVRFLLLLRSSRDSMLTACAESLSAVFTMAGMKVELSGHYPAWQPNPHSQIVELMQGIYRELFNTENRVQVIHAGLECGIIGTLRPTMDLVSFGPTLRSPHTPNERCHIPSVDKYWTFVKAILERIPQRG